MECKFCGSQLNLEDEYCPFCGSKNKAAQKHIEDMRHYNQEFTQTKQQVLKESKWYSRYLAVMVAIVMAAVVNVAVIAMTQEGYYLQYRYYQLYHMLKGDEVKAMLREWEEAGELEQMELYYEKTSLANLDGASEFLPVIDAYSYQERLKSSLIQFSMTPVAQVRRRYVEDEGYVIERIASSIENLYSVFTQENYGWARDGYEGIHLEHLQEMEQETELWLKAYLYFTEEDIEALPDMQKYEILSLIDRRISEHE